MCAVAFCITHGNNKTRRFDNKGFVPFASLCGVVGSPSLFYKCLIGITVDILSGVYINAKLIYLLETAP